MQICFYQMSEYFMKVKEVIKITENDGWYLTVSRESHRQYKHRMVKKYLCRH